MNTLASRLLSFAAYVILFTAVPAGVGSTWAWIVDAPRVVPSSWAILAGCLAAVFFWIRSIKLSGANAVIERFCDREPQLGLEITSARGLLLVGLAVGAVSLCLHAANLWMAVATDTPYIRPAPHTQLAFTMIGFMVVEYVSHLIALIRFDNQAGATSNA